MKKGTIRLLIGTRKGGYIAESDRSRKKWKVSRPMEAGADVFHMASDPRHPRSVYAAVNSGWWGPMLFHSKDGGRRWTELPPPLMPLRKDRSPPMGNPEEEQKKRPIVNLWHIEPGHESEPSSLFLGVDPGALYRSDDLGATWAAVPGLNEHPTREKWNPGAGGLCLHTMIIDPDNPRRMYAGISAAGTFRSEDGGEHWSPVNRGVRVSFLPDPTPEVGQCVHHVVMDPADHSTLYRQDHDGIYVSHDRMDSWKRVGKPLPHDFGFVVAAPAATPGEAYFVPLHPMARTTEGGSMQVYRWTEKSRKWAKTIPAGQFPGEMGTHREGLAADSLDPAGLYLGTTTGELIFSRDGARHWELLPYQFPGIHSVQVDASALTR
jgi:hypothetical protein